MRYRARRASARTLRACSTWASSPAAATCMAVARLLGEQDEHGGADVAAAHPASPAEAGARPRAEARAAGVVVAMAGPPAGRHPAHPATARAAGVKCVGTVHERSVRSVYRDS